MCQFYLAHPCLFYVLTLLAKCLYCSFVQSKPYVEVVA